MNNRKTLNILFLLALGAVALVFIVYNFLEYQSQQNKNKAQTMKANLARMEKLKDKEKPNEADTTQDQQGSEVIN